MAPTNTYTSYYGIAQKVYLRTTRVEQAETIGATLLKTIFPIAYVVLHRKYVTRRGLVIENSNTIHDEDDCDVRNMLDI